MKAKDFVHRRGMNKCICRYTQSVWNDIFRDFTASWSPARGSVQNSPIRWLLKSFSSAMPCTLQTRVLLTSLTIYTSFHPLNVLVCGSYSLPSNPIPLPPVPWRIRTNPSLMRTHTQAQWVSQSSTAHTLLYTQSPGDLGKMQIPIQQVPGGAESTFLTSSQGPLQ